MSTQYRIEHINGSNISKVIPPNNRLSVNILEDAGLFKYDLFSSKRATKFLKDTLITIINGIYNGLFTVRYSSVWARSQEKKYLPIYIFDKYDRLYKIDSIPDMVTMIQGIYKNVDKMKCQLVLYDVKFSCFSLDDIPIFHVKCYVVPV